MIRLDINGRDISSTSGLWSDTDLVIKQTNYNHPDITSGMHTNGPASTWVRFGDSGEWTCFGRCNAHRILRAWNTGGRKSVMELLESIV